MADSSVNRWEHLPHGADIGVRGYGDSKATAFAQAALAMTAILADPATVTPRVEVAITCEAPDDELLLVDWLNALLYEMATRRLLFRDFQVQIADHQLHARAQGEAVNPQKHPLGVEVKGATYTELHVCQQPDGTWLAQCVVDV